MTTRIQRLENGTLLIPVRVEGDSGMIGDTMQEVKVADEGYARWLTEYEREQDLERQEKEVMDIIRGNIS